MYSPCTQFVAYNHYKHKNMEHFLFDSFKNQMFLCWNKNKIENILSSMNTFCWHKHCFTHTLNAASMQYHMFVKLDTSKTDPNPNKFPETQK